MGHNALSLNSPRNNRRQKHTDIYIGTTYTNWPETKFAIFVPVPSTNSFSCIRPSPYFPSPRCPTSSTCLFLAFPSRIGLYIIQRMTKRTVAPPVTNNVSLLAFVRCPPGAPQTLATVDTRPVDAAYIPGLGIQ